MHEQPDSQLTVPQALGHLRVSLQDAFVRAGREHGLTAPQAELLCAALVPTSIGRLAQTLRCDRTNVTHLAERAARHGWLERRVDRHDRRSALLALTPEGHALAQRFLTTLEGQLAELLESWGSQRQRTVAKRIAELAHALDRSGGPPAES